MKKYYMLTIVSLFIFCSNASAQTIFSDSFDTNAKPVWGNEIGKWVASGGVYYATEPGNSPVAYSSIITQKNLRDFTVKIDIKNCQDGGIFLRSVKCKDNNVSGVLLVTLGSSNQLYWHIVSCEIVGPIENSVTIPDLKGSTIHLKIVVSGNTYSVYLNDKSKPVTTLTTDKFSNGSIALYSNSSQSFDNIIISKMKKKNVAK